MNKNVLLNLILTITCVVLSIALPIIFASYHILDFVNGGELAMYIVSKVIVLGMLGFVTASMFLRKLNIYYGLFTFSFTFAYQLLPLLIRLLAQISRAAKWSWIITLLVTIIAIAVYFAVFFTYQNANKRFETVLENSKASEVKTKETNDYFDANGDLKCK